MFKRFMKTALSLAMSIAIILSVTVVASAAGEPGVTVKLGTGDQTVVDIQVKEGRTYAPFDYLFQALGATATFADGTVTAVLGSTTATFKLGDNKMTVAVGTASQSVTMNAIPYQDTSKRIYVPIRFAAQALGYVVSWDASNQTIVLQSVDDLMTQSGATYTIIDQYLASQKEFAAKKHAVSGSLSLNMNIAPLDGATSSPLSINGTLSGLAAQSSAEMNIKMTTNASVFAGSMSGGDTMDAQTKLILSMLDKLEMNFIVNSQTGMIYIQAPIVTTLLGQKTDSWLSMDLNKLAPGVSLSTLNNGVGNFKEYLSTLLKGMCLNDSGASATNVKELLKQINAIISDQAFVKDGSNYVSTSSIDMGPAGAGEKLVLKLTMKFNGTTYNGMAVDISMNMGDQGSMSMTGSFDATGSGSFNMKFDVPSVLTMDMTTSFTYTETTLTPAVQPPTGSTIIPIEDMFSGMMPGLTA